MERVAASAPGQVEVCGHWHGIRGRRFVRPTLTMTRASDGSEVRVLADLEHKPWAAQDGEEWVATFTTDVRPDEASAIELSVAPDITVMIAGEAREPAPPRRRRRPGATGETGTAGEARDLELERLRTRTAAAAEAVERERERRQALEEALESERAEGRRVRIELGQLRAELELARAARAESGESAAELDRVQRELYEARQQLERTERERDRAARAHAETRTALHEQTGALESAREALDRQRSESARPHEHAPPAPRGGRPAPASLYHRSSWGGRMLAVLVLAGVAIVIVLLIEGAIGH